LLVFSYQWAAHAAFATQAWKLKRYALKLLLKCPETDSKKQSTVTGILTQCLK